VFFTYHLLEQNSDAEVIDLARSCWGNEEGETIAQHRLNYHSQQCPKLWVGIRHDGQLIAMASGVRSWACEHMFDVGWICTAPAFRGQGLARDMMAILAAWWLKNGSMHHPHLVLSCLSENVGLYEKLGFNVILWHHSKAAIMAARAQDILNGRSTLWAETLDWERNPFHLGA
jgi:GNAT superfamily N-acetyltransferase